MRRFAGAGILDATAGDVGGPGRGVAAATVAAGELTGISNLVSGDVLTWTGTATAASMNAGTQSLSSLAGLTLGGTDAGNYTVTGGSGSLVINPLTLVLAPVVSTKTYDGSTSASFANNTTAWGSNVISGDIVTFSGTAAFADKNAGAGKTVNITGIAKSGAQAGNYTLTSTTAHVRRWAYQQPDQPAAKQGGKQQA